MGSVETHPELVMGSRTSSYCCPSRVRDVALRHARVTCHAHERCQQRSVPLATLTEVVRWGTAHHVRGGRLAFFLGRRCKQRAAASGTYLDVHANIVVIVASCGTIVTVYRTNNLRHLRGGAR